MVGQNAASGCSDPVGTVGFLLCRAGQHLRAAMIEGPRQEARMLLGHVLGVTADAVIRSPRAAVSAAKVAVFLDLLKRRLAGEPMAHLLGSRGFWTLDLTVSPATLIPRPDSESLVEAALAAFPDRAAALRVLDLGTGTGALLLATLSEFPAAFGVGVDRVAAAAALARENATRHGLAGRAVFLVGDWGGALGAGFDLVLCNPPYIPTAEIVGLQAEVARYEPASALDGGVDGLDAYRRVMVSLPGLLRAGGVAILELGVGQSAAVSTIARAAGLAVEGCHADLGGVVRALVVKKPIGGEGMGA